VLDRDYTVAGLNEVQQTSTCTGLASPGSKKPVSLAGDAHMSVALYVVELPTATCTSVSKSGLLHHS